MNVTVGVNELTENFTNITHSVDIERSGSKYYFIIVICLILSLICLLVIAVVYNIIKEFKNLHGKILLSLCGCLAITYTFLIFDLMLRRKFATSICISVGYVIHVTFLATFFWTNIMAYDVWRTISGMKPKRTVTSKRRYLYYALYAWIATLFASLPALVLDNTDLVPFEYRPNVGIKRCWLSGTPAFLIYFNGPVGLILFANLIFFILTVWTLLKFSNTTKILQIKKDKKRFYLYIKLFLIMGMIWITEFIPWISGIYKLYTVAGILNSLHGVYLFFIFICKRKILRNLRYIRQNKTISSKSPKISHLTLGASFKNSSSVFYCSSCSDNIENYTVNRSSIE